MAAEIQPAILSGRSIDTVSISFDFPRDNVRIRSE